MVQIEHNISSYQACFRSRPFGGPGIYSYFDREHFVVVRRKSQFVEQAGKFHQCRSHRLTGPSSDFHIIGFRLKINPHGFHVPLKQHLPVGSREGEVEVLGIAGKTEQEPQGCSANKSPIGKSAAVLQG